MRTNDRVERVDMAGRKSIAITDRQFQVLEVLWEHNTLTVRELMDHLPSVSQPYTTVPVCCKTWRRPALRTRRMLINYRYRPTLDRRKPPAHCCDFASRFFASRALVLGLVDSQTLAEELGEIDASLNQSTGASVKSDGGRSKNKSAGASDEQLC